MKASAALLVPLLWLALGGVSAPAQETTAVPGPLTPGSVQTTQTPSGTAQKTAAPVERRTPHANSTSTEPVSGPLTKASGAGQQAGQSAEPAQKTGPEETGPEETGPQKADREKTGPQKAGGAVGTIHVEARLVNVALNVVDAHGAPVGGFEKPDFQVFEDGKPQTIAVFEREATSPLSIVLAIDSSETVLTSDRLERAAAKHFVNAILRPQDELDLMGFSDTVREIVPFTNDPKRIERGLGELEQGDETALYNAVYLAGQRLGSTSQAGNRRRVLVVISDGGDDLEHGVHYEQAVEEAQRADAIIYSIIIVPVMADAGRDTGGEHTLIQMSEDTGGKYYYVVDPADLEPAFRHISDDLRTQYLLGYYAPEGGSGFRRIQVKLTNPVAAEKYSLRYRTGYFP